MSFKRGRHRPPLEIQTETLPPAGDPPAARRRDPALADPVVRRRRSVALTGAERQRERRAPARIQTGIRRLVKALEKELASVDADIDAAVRGSPAWCGKEDLLTSVPGIRPMPSGLNGQNRGEDSDG